MITARQAHSGWARYLRVEAAQKIWQCCRLAIACACCRGVLGGGAWVSVLHRDSWIDCYSVKAHQPALIQPTCRAESQPKRDDIKQGS